MKEHMGEQKAAASGEAWKAGATVGTDTLEQGDGLPIIPGCATSMAMWASSRRSRVRQALDVQQGHHDAQGREGPRVHSSSGFLTDVRDGGKPRSDINVGLQDSVAVMLANLAMDEERKVYFSEIEQMGKDGTNLSDGGTPVQAGGGA
ncbi:MAG: hypothetical protein R2748_21815 [Bryobacterales bacterium]